MNRLIYSIVFLSAFGLTNAAYAQNPKVSSHSFVDGTVNSSVLKLKSELEGALGYLSQITYRQVSLQIPQPPSDELLEADKSYNEGKDFYKDKKYQEAFTSLTKALTMYDKLYYAISVEGKAGKKRMRNVLRRLAAMAFKLKDKKAAEQYLLRFLSWRPKAKPKRVAKYLHPMFKKIKEDYSAKQSGKVIITTDPPGATVYFKTKNMNASPVSIETAEVGEAVVVAVMPGYEVSVEKFNLEDKKDKTLHIVMKPRARGILGTLINTKVELIHKTPGSNITASFSALKVDMMVFYTLEVKGGSDVTVTAYLYDARLNTKLNEIKQSFNASSFKSEDVKHFVNKLFTGVPLDGKWPVAKPKPKPGVTLMTKFKKFQQSKYFWPAVGGIGGAIIIGTVTAIILATGGDNYYPSGGRYMSLK